MLIHKESPSLTGIRNAADPLKIAPTSLPINNSTNFSYSIWFNVSQWDETSQKVLLQRSAGENNTFSPKITLGEYENDINIEIATYDGVSGINTCKVRNFPLQKWVNLIISLHGRTLDVYLNGKLVRTCVLAGPAQVSSNAQIQLTPNNGFTGQTSNLQYFTYPLNPQEAYNIYKKGYTSYGFGSIFEKYKIKIAYLVDGVEEDAWQI